MDDATLRQLATELIADLPSVIPDAAERGPVAQELTAALADPEPGPLADALEGHPAVRSWMRDHTGDVVRTSLPGLPTTAIGIAYVCPEEDEDIVLVSMPAQPPLCPNHHIPMILDEQG